MTGKIFNFPSGRVGSSSKGVRPPREAHGVGGIFFSFQNEKTLWPFKLIRGKVRMNNFLPISTGQKGYQPH